MPQRLWTSLPLFFTSPLSLALDAQLSLSPRLLRSPTTFSHARASSPSLDDYHRTNLQLTCRAAVRQLPIPTTGIMSILISKSLAGPAYLILNTIRALNIVGLLLVATASILMLVKTITVSRFFFFDGCSHVITACISCE